MLKIRSKVYTIAVTGALVFLLSGCSMLAPSTQRFNVNTNTSDAQIFLNGSYVGNGSITTTVRRDRVISVTAKKDGYEPVSMYVGTQLSTTGKLDAFPGGIFIFPLAGLAFPGSQELMMDSVTFYFPPLTEAAGVVNIANSDGTTTAVHLTKKGNGYVGPQGEYYEGTPTMDQLKALYGR